MPSAELLADGFGRIRETVADVLFLRHLPWQRLLVNVAIVLVFGACYFIFFKRP